METFFYGEDYCSDLDSLLGLLDLEEDEIRQLPDDWSIECDEAELQPILKLTASDLARIVCDSYEERISEDGNDFDDLATVFKKCIDFEKLNAEIPRYYYRTGKVFYITKADLMEYIK